MKKILLVIIAISLLMFTSCEYNTSKTCTVSFNANGGIGTMPAQEFIKGIALNLVSNEFRGPVEKPFFKGWTSDSTKKEYTSNYDKTAPTYYEYNELITVSKNITLYALWGEENGVGNFGEAGIIFYDVDADNDSTNEGRGLDNLSSATNIASGDMPANWRYLEAAEYNIKIDDNETIDDESDDIIGLGTSKPNDRTSILFGYYRADGGSVNNFYANADVAGDGTLSGGSANGTALGTGASNTEKLVAAMKEDGSQAFTSGSSTTENYAANVCSKLEVEKDGTTYLNWFLPSKDELALMYENLYMKGLGNLDDSIYWSSSEADTSGAWMQYFSSGNQSKYSRGGDFSVRVIRAF